MVCPDSRRDEAGVGRFFFVFAGAGLFLLYSGPVPAPPTGVMMTDPVAAPEMFHQLYEDCTDEARHVLTFWLGSLGTPMRDYVLPCTIGRRAGRIVVQLGADR